MSFGATINSGNGRERHVHYTVIGSSGQSFRGNAWLRILPSLTEITSPLEVTSVSASMPNSLPRTGVVELLEGDHHQRRNERVLWKSRTHTPTEHRRSSDPPTGSPGTEVTPAGLSVTRCPPNPCTESNSESCWAARRSHIWIVRSKNVAATKAALRAEAR